MPRKASDTSRKQQEQSIGKGPCQTCKDFLFPSSQDERCYWRSPKMDKDKERSNVHRALSVLGHVCHFHNDESTLLLHGETTALVAVSPSDLTSEILPTSSFVLFKQHLEKLDTDTKCEALRAMSRIFSAHPRGMLAFEQERVLQGIMSNSARISKWVRLHSTLSASVPDDSLFCSSKV